MDYIDIIEKSIYNIDSKICGIIDDYKVLQDSQKVAKGFYKSKYRNVMELLKTSLK